MLYFKIRTYALLIICMLPMRVMANGEMLFTGKLVIPPCIVNSNQPVNVQFGDIDVMKMTEANTAYFLKQVIIDLSCSTIGGNPMITMTSTAVHDAAQGVLQTSKYSEGLVVYLRNWSDSKTPLALNVETNYTGMGGGGNQSPKRWVNIWAGIGRIGKLDDLKPGEFTASATVLVDYK